MGSGVDREKLFVKIGLENKYVGEQDLKKAKDFQVQQRARGVEMSIGEALMELKLMNKVQYLAVQRAAHYKVQRASDKILARIIIESDYTPKENVLEAMGWQKDHYLKDGICRGVGDILIERGHISVEQFKAAQKILQLKGAPA